MEIKAAGITFYKLEKTNKFFLFTIDSKNKLWDIGGKHEEEDINPLETAIREWTEEVNPFLQNEIKIEDLKKYVENVHIEEFYVPKAKYMIYICKAPPFLENQEINNEPMEIDGKMRQTLWLSKKDVNEFILNNNISPRLWKKEFLNKFKQCYFTELSLSSQK